MWRGATGFDRTRVLKGHVGAVHALRLCGVPFTECARIVGISPERMKDYVAEDWVGARQRRGRWYGAERRALAAAYADHSISVRQIVAQFKVSQAALYKVAQKYGWPLRPKGRKAQTVAVRNLTSGKRAYYKALRANGLSLQEALAAAHRGAEPVLSALGGSNA